MVSLYEAEVGLLEMRWEKDSESRWKPGRGRMVEFGRGEGACCVGSSHVRWTEAEGKYI